MKKYKFEKVDYRNCEIERRVMLRTGYFIPAEENPVIDSIHQCAGTIKFFTTTLYRLNGLTIRVKWDNGHSNYYTEDQLLYFEDSKEDLEPVCEENYISIW